MKKIYHCLQNSFFFIAPHIQFSDLLSKPMNTFIKLLMVTYF